MSTPKHLFLLERFWPGVTTAGAQAAARRLHAASSRSGRGSSAVRHLRSGLLPHDEVMWSMVEARSGDAIIAVTTQARHPVDRISESIVVGAKQP
jgi:hypothetical protein